MHKKLGECDHRVSATLTPPFSEIRENLHTWRAPHPDATAPPTAKRHTFVLNSFM